MKLRVRHVKCILSFREEETKVKIQMVDLFHRKPDVYIRQLQVRKRISAINSPTPQLPSGLFAEPPSGLGGRIQKLNTFLLTSMLVPHLLSKLNVTARHWIVLRKENRGGVAGGWVGLGGGGGGGS